MKAHPLADPPKGGRGGLDQLVAFSWNRWSRSPGTAGRHRWNAQAAPEGDEPGGTAATQAMLELVQGHTLRCELDGERTHDRCVGVCYLDDQDVAAIMVRQGLARDCARYSGGRYRAAEQQAAEAGATISGRYPLPAYCR